MRSPKEIALKVDVIVYGDFLERRTSQAENMEGIIAVLKEKHLLGRVICRDSSCFDYTKAIPFGSFFPKVVTFFEKVARINMRNFSQNTLFDFFASRKIRSRYVIASVAGLRRCLSETRQRGGVFIEMELMEHPKMFAKKLEQESERWSLPLETSTFEYFKNFDYTANHADYLIAISGHAKDTFVDNGVDGERIFVSGLGIDGSRFNSSARSDRAGEKFKVVYIAHTQILKGLQYLLEAWSKLGLTDAELIIGGSIDHLTEKVIRRYLDLGGVSYVGSIKEPEKYYREADVFISPSLSEGLGKSVIEAMACGLPVIVTTGCGVEITDGHDGFIVSPGDSDAIADKIRHCYDDRSGLVRMGMNARSTFEAKYSDQAFSRQFGEIIDKILSYEAR